MVQDRVVETVSTWFGREPVVLESRSLDLAVALGAATFGLVLAGKGVRIRGGTARAYYVGVEGAAPRQRQGVCLIPFGVRGGGRGGHRGPGLRPASPTGPSAFPSSAQRLRWGTTLATWWRSPRTSSSICRRCTPCSAPTSGDPAPAAGVGGGRRGEPDRAGHAAAVVRGRLRSAGTWSSRCAAPRSCRPRVPRPAAQVGDATLEVGDEQQALAAEAIRAGFRRGDKQGDSPRALIKRP